MAWESQRKRTYVFFFQIQQQETSRKHPLKCLLYTTPSRRSFFRDLFPVNQGVLKHWIWIWVNDVATEALFFRTLEIMVSKGNHPQMAARFRLVKYYNLPRWMDFWKVINILLGNLIILSRRSKKKLVYTSFCIHLQMHVFLLYKMQIFHFHFSKLHFCARRFSGTFVWYVYEFVRIFSEFSTAYSWMSFTDFECFYTIISIVRSSKIHWFKIG